MALDFPASPTDGQTYNQYVYDATAGVWQLDRPSSDKTPVDAIVSAASVTPTYDGDAAVYSFTSDGTITIETAGYADVLLVGGGGGGGAGISNAGQAPAQGVDRSGQDGGSPGGGRGGDGALWPSTNATNGASANVLRAAGGGGGGTVLTPNSQNASGGGGGGRGATGNAGSSGNPGSAANPTSYNCQSVSPGASYPVTVASGGQVNISWNPQ